MFRGSIRLAAALGAIALVAAPAAGLAQSK